MSDFAELVFEENIEEVGEMEVHPIDFLGVALFSPCISRVCIIMQYVLSYIYMITLGKASNRLDWFRLHPDADLRPISDFS